MFNILSIVFGILAVALPILARRKELKKWVIFSIASFSSCISALIFQLLEINDRVEINDIATVMDTIGSLVIVGILISVITVILNTVSLMITVKN